jgi:Flp pilus assembly CpaE family ATPase
VVLNRSHKRDRITSRDIEKTLGHPVFWSLPNDYATAIESINSGQPLVSFNSTGLARSYTDLAKKLAGAPMESQKRKLMGLFN